MRRLLLALPAALVAFIALATAPHAKAASTDVSLTVDPPTAYYLQMYQEFEFPFLNDPEHAIVVTGTPGSLLITGGVSCPSTPVFTEVQVEVSQGKRQLTTDGSFGNSGFAQCDPRFGSGFWAAVLSGGTGHLNPGTASVRVTLTLDDGTVVTASSPIRIMLAPRSSQRVDTTYPTDLDFFCGFPVIEHDVGLEQSLQISAVNGQPRFSASHFVGTTTFTNLSNGTSVAFKTATFTRTTFGGGDLELLKFAGLNYSVRTSSGMLISAGHGVEDFVTGGETATPHLGHLTDVICELLASG